MGMCMFCNEEQRVDVNENVSMYMYICIFTYTHTCTCLCVYIYASKYTHFTYIICVNIHTFYLHVVHSHTYGVASVNRID